MSSSKGSRSRNGCFSCRRRKRRCDEEKPICASCRRTGAECIYPNSPAAITPMKFIVATSADHHMLPIKRSDRRASFLNLTPHDMETFCSKFQSSDAFEPHHDSDNDEAIDLRWDSDLYSNAKPDTRLLRIVSPFAFTQTPEALQTLETALIQYYAEVISSSRAYVPTGRNHFLTSVMPHILMAKGPLYSTALAMSAAEWGQNVVTNGKDYRAISAQYKVRALGELQRSLCDDDSAEESLLTCILMSSLEIASGSRPAWLRHFHGAVALLDSFATSIDPAVAKFALDYFRFRYILLKTTEPRSHPEQTGPTDAPEASYDHAMTCLIRAEASLPFVEESKSMINEHIGCSMEGVDVINQITALSLAVGQKHRQETRDHLYSEGQALEHKIRQMNPQSPSDYLVKSAECFRIAAQIYLRLVCFDTSITHPSILEPHQDLLDLLSDTIVEDQPRRSFPMWPLFIAGCTCSSDDQRKTVLDLFTILDGQWPISNIAAVWKAVRTVWQARDLSASSLSCKHDWQEIIHKFGWKLALS